VSETRTEESGEGRARLEAWLDTHGGPGDEAWRELRDEVLPLVPGAALVETHWACLVEDLPGGGTSLIPSQDRATALRAGEVMEQTRPGCRTSLVTRTVWVGEWSAVED
jgi:hypothetical protein